MSEFARIPRSVIANQQYVFFRNYDEAIRIMQRATTIPRNVKVNFYDEVSNAYS